MGDEMLLGGGNGYPDFVNCGHGDSLPIDPRLWWVRKDKEGRFKSKSSLGVPEECFQERHLFLKTDSYQQGWFFYLTVKITVIRGIKVSPVVLVDRFDLPGLKYKLLISEAAAHQVLAHRTVLTVYGKEENTHGSWMLFTSLLGQTNGTFNVQCLLRLISQVSKEQRSKIYVALAQLMLYPCFRHHIEIFFPTPFLLTLT